MLSRSLSLSHVYPYFYKFQNFKKILSTISLFRCHLLQGGWSMDCHLFCGIHKSWGLCSVEGPQNLYRLVVSGNEMNTPSPRDPNSFGEKGGTPPS